MQTFIISSVCRKQKIVKDFETMTDARHWVINYCDLSGDDWMVTPAGLTVVEGSKYAVKDDGGNEVEFASYVPNALIS